MNKYIVIVIVAIAINSTGCVSGGPIEKSVATYGYSKTNPIKCGGGPEGEHAYLESLSGPNGEQISFTRLGSCCPFETSNSPFGKGLLDIFEVTYKGLKKPILLYLNMYDKEETHPPRGFRFRQ